MDLVEHRRLLNSKGSDSVKRWVKLEDLTISTPQKLSKKYDSSYDDYMCEIVFPTSSGDISTKETIILGNYALYYNTIRISDNFPYVILLKTEKLTDKTCLVSRASGNDSSINGFFRKEINIINNIINVSNIDIDFVLPAGTRIRVWGR